MSYESALHIDWVIQFNSNVSREKAYSTPPGTLYTGNIQG